MLAGALAQTPTEADLGLQVLQLFQRECNECHNADEGKPEGDFGFVTDLPRLADDEAYVVRGDPDNSEVFLVMVFGDMPPPKSKHGKASEAEIELVKQWILAGAPPAPEGAAEQIDAEVEPPAAQPVVDRTLSWLGRLHPATVHFPVAFLVGAALLELWSMIRRQPDFQIAVRACVWIGALGALAAATFGWLHADYAGFSDATVLRHRVMGIAAAAWGVLTVFLIERQHRRDLTDRSLVRIALVAGAIIVSLAGHLGGMITYGPNHYQW